MHARRDVALIGFAALTVVAALVAVVVLTIKDRVDPVAALGAVTAVIGLGGVALGRLSAGGPPAGGS